MSYVQNPNTKQPSRAPRLTPNQKILSSSLIPFHLPTPRIKILNPINHIIPYERQEGRETQLCNYLSSCIFMQRGKGINDNLDFSYVIGEQKYQNRNKVYYTNIPIQYTYQQIE